eukprot:112866_1
MEQNVLESDLTPRLEWKVGAKVSVYSQSQKAYVSGTIDAISMDGREEWISVRYEEIAKVQRYGQDIKPYSEDTRQADDPLKIFKQNDDENAACDRFNNDPTKCVAIQRLLSALKLYNASVQKTQIRGSDDNSIATDVDAFHRFMNEVYTQCVDDYTHLVTMHNEHLHDIRANAIRIIGDCDMKQCRFTSRHHTSNRQNETQTETVDSFHASTMDSLHFWLFHQYDSGLRVLPKQLEDEMNASDATDKEIRQDQYYDREFSRFNREISSRVRETRKMDRFSSASNDKFTLKADQFDARPDHDKGVIEQPDDTYLEEICNHLYANNVDVAYIQQLIEMVQNEEFDSESIQYDIDDGENNVSMYVKDEHFLEALKGFVKASQLSSSSFNIGLRFYYWSWYESKQTIPDEEQDSDNIHDHSGHAVCDLYVTKKYATFKEEISHYPSVLEFSMVDYKHLVTKVNQYTDSKIVKASKACGGFTYDTREGHFHYAVDRESCLSFDHLVAVLLYTDYTKLSSNFTSSFRKKHVFETLQSIKRRNREYWWWSKTLRETVEIYGGCRWGDGYYDSGRVRNRVRGPFYTGMSFVMNLPAFNIRLCSPTSTSKQFAVANRFSGDKGLVLQFDNPDIEVFRFTRAFNCSWISRFKEEDERLFFGGYHPLRVVSVRLIETKQNFAPIIYLFNYFDKMVSGATRMDMRSTMKITPADKIMLRQLLDHVLGNSASTQYDPYIISSFECFCHSKEQIALNLWSLYEINNIDDGKIRNMILHPLAVRDQTDEKKRGDDDTNNLVRHEIFKVFTNLKRIAIASTLLSGKASCSISLVGLLSLFDVSKLLQQVVVTALSDVNGNNWIRSLLPANVNSIQTFYGGKPYTIAVKKLKSKLTDEYWLGIQKSDGSQPIAQAEEAQAEEAQEAEKQPKQEEEEEEKEEWRELEQEITIVSDNYYLVQSKASQQYWDILDASTDNGAPLLQYYYHGNNNQLFSFVHRGDGKYTIHPMCSGKYMEVRDELKANGDMFLQNDGVDGEDKQLFVCEMDSKPRSDDVLPDGCYRFKSVYNGRYVDVPGASMTHGVFMQQWESHKGPSQQFEIKRVNLKNRPIERGMGYIFEMTKHKDADCWLYSWFWTKTVKKEFRKQLKKNSIEEATEWLVKAYRNSDGPDPWMNCMKDATDEEVQGVIDGLIQIKFLSKFYKKRKK